MTHERTAASVSRPGQARGEPDYALIEKLFFAYRDFVLEADRLLAADGFGRAHHRVLYFVARRPDLTVAELLSILRITKQSLNRVLKDLLDRGYVSSRLGANDRRQRRLNATPRGEALIVQVAHVQSAWIEAALSLSETPRAAAVRLLEAMIEGDPKTA